MIGILKELWIANQALAGSPTRPTPWLSHLGSGLKCGASTRETKIATLGRFTAQLLAPFDDYYHTSMYRLRNRGFTT